MNTAGRFLADLNELESLTGISFLRSGDEPEVLNAGKAPVSYL
ncbi:hypothetical protein ACFYQA_37825 [Streptomyces sp. NPDC005774]